MTTDIRPKGRRSALLAYVVAAAVVVTGFAAASPTVASAAPGGILDTTFNANLGTGLNQEVEGGTVVQPDGKIVAVGAFTTVNGVLSSHVARFNADGTPDTAFNTNISHGLDGNAYGVALQADGKIVVVGLFVNQYSGANPLPSKHIARFNSNGTPDTTFRTNLGTGLNQLALAVAVQPDGRIVVGGTFLTQNGGAAGRLARYNADGTADTTFATTLNAGLDGTVQAVALQPDHKIVVLGTFTHASGQVANRIARYNANGTLDTAFATAVGSGLNQIGYSAALQPDGKILITGGFTTVNGSPISRIARLNGNGSIDTGFRTNIGSGLNANGNSLAVQPDGKIVIGGDFTTVNALPSRRITRLNPDGSIDSPFRANVGTGIDGSFPANVSLQRIGEGKIIVSGYQKSSLYNGTAVRQILRLSGGYIAPPRTAQSQKLVSPKLKKRGTKTVNSTSARTRQGVTLSAKVVSKKNKRCVVIKKGPGRKLALKTTGKCRKVTVKVRYSAPGTATYLPYKKNVTFKRR